MTVVRREEQKVAIPIRSELEKEMMRMLKERKETTQKSFIHLEGEKPKPYYKSMQASQEDVRPFQGKVKNCKSKFRLSSSEVEESEELFEEIAREMGMNYWSKNRMRQGGN